MRELLVVVGVLFSLTAFHPTFAEEIFSTHSVDEGKSGSAVASDRSAEGRPLSIFSGVKKSDLDKIMEIKHGNDDFVDKNYHVLHVTGTAESRDAEAEKALARFAKIKHVNLGKLSELQKLTLVARMVRKDKSLSLNVLQSIYNSAVVLKLIGPAAVKANGLDHGKEKLAVTDCIMKEICERLNLPEAYNIQVSTEDSERFTNAMGKAIGEAFGKALGDGIVKASE